MPDLRTLPLDRFCNFLWWWMTRNAQEAQTVERIKATLWRPPPAAAKKPIDPRSPWAPQAETAGFSALKAGLGGKPIPTVVADPEPQQVAVEPAVPGVWQQPPAPPGTRRIPVRPRQ